ncbi:HNH endonuclease [Cellulosimicrobium aquatile]|uniref:HNH endonuclease n=1 Tax=Cellulosimicrobium aquatile TaxID=1612203 RepID=UPI00145939C2|nr:hypothetical protein [Cellulosimicrobium aquatile]NMF27939.1 HNH endonuclease [Cellulosimicrobium aquatile]
MPWVRFGDDSATYPALMKLHGMKGADERTVNEAFGFLARIATLSGAHKTDYEIDAGTAYMIGGARTDELLRLLVKAGVLSAGRRGGLAFWTIRADPEFIHIRTKAELEREARYRNELRDDALRVGLLLRDGDNCRWCGIVVLWTGRKGQQHAEPDHLEGLDVPGTVDNMVIACRRCNRARGADTDLWDAEHELRKPPEHPHYGAHSARFLTKNGYPTEPTYRSDEAPAHHQAAAAPAPAPGVRPAAPPRDPQALAAPAGTAPQRVRPAAPPGPGNGPRNTSRNADRTPISQSDQTGSAGSGRDGSGTSTTHLPGEAGSTTPPPPDPAASPPPQPARRRRGRRGGRRTSPGDDR